MHTYYEEAIQPPAMAMFFQYLPKSELTPLSAPLKLAFYVEPAKVNTGKGAKLLWLLQSKFPLISAMYKVPARLGFVF